MVHISGHRKKEGANLRSSCKTEVRPSTRKQQEKPKEHTPIQDVFTLFLLCLHKIWSFSAKRFHM